MTDDKQAIWFTRARQASTVVIIILQITNIKRKRCANINCNIIANFDYITGQMSKDYTNLKQER
jgi:hypothetical protein